MNLNGHRIRVLGVLKRVKNISHYGFSIMRVRPIVHFFIEMKCTKKFRSGSWRSERVHFIQVVGRALVIFSNFHPLISPPINLSVGFNDVSNCRA